MGTSVLVLGVLAAFVFLGNAPWWFLVVFFVMFSLMTLLMWGACQESAAGEPYLIVTRDDRRLELPRYRVNESLDCLKAIGVRKAVDIRGRECDGESGASSALFVVLTRDAGDVVYDVFGCDTDKPVIETAVRLSDLLGVPVFFGVRGKMRTGWIFG